MRNLKFLIKEKLLTIVGQIYSDECKTFSQNESFQITSYKTVFQFKKREKSSGFCKYPADEVGTALVGSDCLLQAVCGWRHWARAGNYLLPSMVHLQPPQKGLRVMVCQSMEEDEGEGGREEKYDFNMEYIFSIGDIIVHSWCKIILQK